jgi:hypothetical protein
MADEEIPENLDLSFIAAQLRRVLDNQKDATQRFDAMDQRFDAMDQRFSAMDRRFDGVDRRLAEVEVSVGAMRVDQTRATKLIEEIHETQRNHGGRLNVIDGRLAIIEKHTGLVKA